MNLNEAKAKIAKVLRLETSSNSGEAANAAAKVEELCKKYGLTREQSEGYDPQVDEIIEFSFGRTYVKADVPINFLIAGVTKYFNGQNIVIPLTDQFGYSTGKRRMHIIASKGNKIQIELYLDYLIHTMNKLADKAKKSGAYGTSKASYKLNWKKGFAIKVAERLISMKKEQQRVGKPELNQPALVVSNNNSKEQKASLAYFNEKYPRIRKVTRKTKQGIAYSHGVQAGESVGLNKQTKSSKNTLQLTSS